MSGELSPLEWARRHDPVAYAYHALAQRIVREKLEGRRRQEALERGFPSYGRLVECRPPSPRKTGT